MQTPSRSGGSSGERNEIPNAGKLSSGSARSNNPQKRGSGNSGNSGVSSRHLLGVKQSANMYLTVPSICLLFSMVYFMDP